MNELLTQTGSILGKATELLEIPVISDAVKGLFTWLGNVITKKSAKEKLELIQQNNHSKETIIELQNNLKYEIEDNEDLQKELAEKIKEIERLMMEKGVQSTVSNTITDTGNNNKNFQDINNSQFSDNSVHQTHNGSGDIVGGDKSFNK